MAVEEEGDSAPFGDVKVARGVAEFVLAGEKAGKPVIEDMSTLARPPAFAELALTILGVTGSRTAAEVGFERPIVCLPLEPGASVVRSMRPITCGKRPKRDGDKKPEVSGLCFCFCIRATSYPGCANP